jgi:hypothetical protein
MLSESQLSDHRCAKLLLPRLSAARELISDCGYDGSRFRNAFAERGITPCIPLTHCR